MKMNSIKWNREMAERCIRRATQSKDAKTADVSTKNASPERKVYESAGDDHWEEFRNAMDKLLKG